MALFDSRETYEKSDEDEYALRSMELEINDRKGMEGDGSARTAALWLLRGETLSR